MADMQSLGALSPWKMKLNFFLAYPSQKIEDMPFHQVAYSPRP